MSPTADDYEQARQILDLPENTTRDEITAAAQEYAQTVITAIRETLTPVWTNLLETFETIDITFIPPDRCDCDLCANDDHDPELTNDQHRWTPTLDNTEQEFEDWLHQTANTIRNHTTNRP